MCAQKAREFPQSKWAARIVFTPKKDEILRFCVDCRLHSQSNKRETYPIPETDDCIASLCETAVISILYANSGCWQVGNGKSDYGKLALTWGHVCYRLYLHAIWPWKWPGVLQLTVDVIGTAVKWRFASVCLEDIEIYLNFPKKSHPPYLKSFETLN